jgi:hypothetical protein
VQTAETLFSFIAGMISVGAKNFAKFAARATPKHSIRAFSCKQSQKGKMP